MNGSQALIHSYLQSDGAGKAIFLSLLFLSCISWIVLTYKWLQLRRVRKAAHHFQNEVEKHHAHLLKLNIQATSTDHPFLKLYHVLKHHTQILLNKNQEMAGLQGSDLDLIGTYLEICTSQTIKYLERHLFLLSTITTLGPFLGLLGTVWGILTTFAQMSNKTAGVSNDAILAGLAMALGTTILGLLVAIPALIGYNLLKNGNREMHTEMQEFSSFLLATVQMQYGTTQKG